MNQLNKNAQGKESKNCKKPRHAKLELKINLQVELFVAQMVLYEWNRNSNHSSNYCVRITIFLILLKIFFLLNSLFITIFLICYFYILHINYTLSPNY